MFSQEEIDFDFGPQLWDAGDVCCAAFQLGACAHTEGAYYDAMRDLDAEDGFTAWQRANGEHVTVELDGREIVVEAADADSEPF